MSRAFVKEDDQEEPPFIPPRAPLPNGLTNYVTPKGLSLLNAEKDALENVKELAYQEEDEYTRRRAVATVNGKLKLLEERINSARVLKPEDQPAAEVRFGARVYINRNGTSQVLQLVGVDEADAKVGKIAFSAPIAICLTGKKTGETATFKLGSTLQKIVITAIKY